MSQTVKPIEIVTFTHDANQGAYVCLNGKFAALPSRKALKKALKAKRLIKLNDNTPVGELTRIFAGDQIAVLPPINTKPLWKELIPVVYEDEHIAVVYKPAGMLTSGNHHRNLANALPANLMPSHCKDAMPTPQPMHRLDKATQGLVICAKTLTAAAVLSDAFKKGKIEKTYRALVHGRMEQETWVDAPIDGKPAETRIFPMNVYQTAKEETRTELLLFPLQGRTHQLRKHLHMIQHPIVGDRIYGELCHPRGSALRLKAEALKFDHPIYGFKIVLRY